LLLSVLRIGTVPPSVYVTRLFLRQTIGLSADAVQDDGADTFSA
jgi:hypothetical protein